MPVTKTAKRALRGSLRKKKTNDAIRRSLEVAIRSAKKTKSDKAVRAAVSLADKATKKKLIHKNKAGHIKSALSKLVKKVAKPKASPKTTKKASKK